MDNEKKHPSIFEPFALILNIVTAVIGAIIGMQIVTTLGVTPNTAIIGALVAMLIARIPITIFNKYKSVHRQNLVQTSISSATFGAANSLLIPIGIPFAMGVTDLVVPMLIGAALAMFVDAAILYKLFDSKLFPASGTWAPGVATAESIKAGDKGGKRAGLLGIGTAIGLIGSYFNISMSAFGVAFIGNIWALTMFGIGLMIRQYSVPWFHVDVNQLYIAHGVMIGAGIVALIQAGMLIFSKQNKSVKKGKAGENSITASSEIDESKLTRTVSEARRTLSLGFIAYLLIALLIALIGGLITHMSIGMLIGFMVFAAFAAFVHELIVGIAAMHSGWFPAFAVAFITLLFGMMIGFPPVALALLAGFSAATGPAFADMGYDLKTGYILRGNGENKEYELEGRKHQYITGMIAFGVALLTVLVTYKGYFAQNLVPPIDKVYVSTIQAGASPEVAKQLLIWAIPGAIVQLLGGPSRQIGVLFATGLLIATPNACWAVLVGIAIRIIVLKIKGKEAETPMSILAAGFIAGDALYSFFNSVFKMKK
ncbi:OPT oligopeptide transporter protein [Paenibacillus konkukensis]|uniref:OPT oligopeptide transporter protein n=1 Tax=Paenibacillus konkukensis TaxID=2020716 RepID=A0ABY4RKD7_9BACL|nr:OPT/YSL family transporter [Paenibacillus konkukensis]UQZ82911.1 OPT oligopeptide transporter protein [Paenibacillus konkukensis]